MAGILTQFIRVTAWKTQPIQPYSPLHFCIFAVGLAFCLLLAQVCNRFRFKESRILIFVGAFLLITEVYKQIFYTVIRDQGNYDLSLLPFQLCSMPVYFCFLLPAVPSGRIREAVCCFLSTFNLLGGLFALAAPFEIFTGYISITIQSVLWHIILIFLGLYLLLRCEAGYKLRAFTDAAGLFFFLCAIAAFLNRILNPFSIRPMRLFFVGLNSPDIPFFNEIFRQCGWWVSSLSYMLAVTLGAFLQWLFGNWVIGRVRKHARRF